MRRQEVIAIANAALECSVYVAPREPGLTHAELFEVCGRLGYEKGEVGGVLQMVAAPMYFGDARLMPQATSVSSDFNFPRNPDYRNVAAFDFVCRQLQALARSEGAQHAQLDRSVVVARAVASGLPEHDVEVAVTVLVMTEHMAEQKGVLRLAPGREHYLLPNEQVNQTRGSRVDGLPRNEARARAYPVVRDVIARRTDGRPSAAEPLDAFAGDLEKLGYDPFRLWWTQTVAELRQLDTSVSPVAVAVLAAALVEGALTLVVKHARGLGLGVFASKDFDRDPRSWRIDNLISGASAGRDAAILDAPARARADELIRIRQRIHAGRMISDYPAGVPDLRPEEAREAKATAELIVRRVLDWLQKYPGSGVA